MALPELPNHRFQLGLRLREIRDKKFSGSAAATAQMCGISPQEWSNLESGRRRIRASILAALAEKLGCDPGWLLTGQEPSHGVAEHSRRYAAGPDLSRSEITIEPIETKIEKLRIEDPSTFCLTIRQVIRFRLQPERGK